MRMLWKNKTLGLIMAIVLKRTHSIQSNSERLIDSTDMGMFFMDGNIGNTWEPEFL